MFLGSVPVCGPKGSETCSSRPQPTNKVVSTLVRDLEPPTSVPRWIHATSEVRVTTRGPSSIATQTSESLYL